MLKELEYEIEQLETVPLEKPRTNREKMFDLLRTINLILAKIESKK